jgi:prevent-host-death family protein
MVIAISKTDLARNTREIVDQVRHGQTIIVESYGEEQIVLLDALDYRLLRAVIASALKSESSENSNEITATMSLYLDEKISLAKAAEQLGLSRFDLMDRFERLGVPLRLGPATLVEAQDEIASAQRGKTTQE